MHGQLTTREADQTPKDLGELARAADNHIANEEFEEGFRLFNLAEEIMTSEDYELTADEAVDVGNTLATIGHADYNYDIRDLNEISGHNRFQQAAQLFQYGIEHDPSNSRAYLGLSDMQQELGDRDSSTQTVAQLEAFLEENPKEDTTETRLGMAARYRSLEDQKSAARSYAKAIDTSIDEDFSRFSVAKRLKEYLGKRNNALELDEFEQLVAACRRAVIMDPDSPHFRSIAFSLYSCTQKHSSPTQQ